MAVITIGTLGLICLLFLLYYTIKYLQHIIVEPVDAEKSAETYLMRALIVIVCAVLFISIWRKVRDAHYANKYKNKGMFGRPIKTQPNGLVKLTLQEYEQQMKETTEREKTKLFNSEEYGEAVKMKGWG